MNGESFNGNSGNTNISRTFTITAANHTLQTIDIYAGTGAGTGSRPLAKKPGTLCGTAQKP